MRKIQARCPVLMTAPRCREFWTDLTCHLDVLTRLRDYNPEHDAKGLVLGQ